jgi:arylsulfatase A-like enzyme
MLALACMSKKRMTAIASINWLALFVRYFEKAVPKPTQRPRRRRQLAHPPAMAERLETRQVLSGGSVSPVIIGIGSDTGFSSADGVTSDKTLFLSGTATAGFVVSVSRNGTLLGTATADGTGTWNYDDTATSLNDGTYLYTASTSDGQGGTASGQFTVRVDTQTPGVPVITTLNNRPGNDPGLGLQYRITGTAEAGSRVEIIQVGRGVVGTVVADTTGNWTLDADGPPANGSYKFVARAADTAGNVSGTTPSRTLRPNIILINTDDQAVNSLPVMSSLTQFFNSYGTTFRNGYVPTGVSGPSRASLLTGMNPERTGVFDNATPWGGHYNFDDSFTIATLLDDAGYRTGLFGKYETRSFAQYQSTGQEPPPGWDEFYAITGISRVFAEETYLGYELTENGNRVRYGNQPSDYITDVLTNKVESFVGQQGNSQDPFFAYVALNAPHTPFVPAPRHVGALNGIAPWRPPSFNVPLPGGTALTPAEIAKIDADRQRHLEMLLAVDEGFARLIQKLRDTGEINNTVIAYTSDNGYSFGEHALSSKGTLFDESVKIPFNFFDGRVPRGQIVDTPVSNIDLAPTFVQMAGEAVEPSMDGVSLSPLLSGQPLGRDAIYFTNVRRTEIGVRTDRYKYIEQRSGSPELYDLWTDPYEMSNLIDVPAHAATVASMAALLAAHTPSDVTPPIIDQISLGVDDQNILIGARVSDASTGGSQVRMPQFSIDTPLNIDDSVLSAPVPLFLASDGRFDSPTENVVGRFEPINTMFLSSGLHQLWVRARDVVGNWTPWQSRPFYLAKDSNGTPLAGLTQSQLPTSQIVVARLSVDSGGVTVVSSIPGGLTASQISGNGTNVVTLTGTVGQLNATLNAPNAVQYVAPIGIYGAGSVTWSIDGGAPEIYSLLRVRPTYSIGGVPVSVPYTTNRIYVRLAPGATIAPVAGGTPAKLTVTMTNNNTATDFLVLLSEGNGANQVGIDRTTISYGGQVVGTLTGGVQAWPLVVTFNSQANNVVVQAVLRRLHFYSTLTQPSAVLRTLTYWLTESSGAQSPPVYQIVNLSSAPPVLTLPTVVRTYPSGNTGIALAPDAVVEVTAGAVTGSVLTVQGTFVGPNDRLLLLSQGTATGQLSLNGNQVLFGGTVVGTMTPQTTGTDPLTVQFNSSATTAAVQAVVRSVAFRNVTSAPTSFTRTISWNLVDGRGASAIARSSQVNVSPAPTLTLPTLVQTYPAGSPGVAMVPDAIVEVSSSAVNGSVLTVLGTYFGPHDRVIMLSQGTATGQVSLSGDQVLFGGTVVATMTLPATSSETLTVRFNSAATSAAIQAVARSVAFRNVALVPGIFERTISWQIVDGLGVSSGSRVSQLNVSPAPTLSFPTGAQTYPSGSAGVSLVPDAVVEVAAAAVNGSLLTVQGISFGSDDRLSLLSQGTASGQISLSGNQVLFEGTTVGTVTLPTNSSEPLTVQFNSAATSAAVQAVVRSVAYNNLALITTLSERIISWQLVDGLGVSANARSSQVIVSPPPALTLPTIVQTYPSGNAGVALAPDALAEVTAAAVNGSLLTVQGVSFGQDDRLLLLTQDNGGGQILLSGDVIVFGGAAVGVVTLPTNSGEPLTVRFTSSATSAAVQAVVRSVAFSNLTLATSQSERTIMWRLNDGLGASSTSLSTQVIVIPSPTLTLPTLVQTYPAGSPGVALVPDAILEISSSAVNGSVLTVLGTYFGPHDRLVMLSQGTEIGQVSLSGDQVLFGGTPVATVTLPTTSSETLTIRFNSAATSAAVQAVGRSVAFRNVALVPGIFERIISWQLVDGLGASSGSRISKLNVSAAPTLTLPTTVQTYPSGDSGLALAPDAVVVVTEAAVNGSVMTVQGISFGIDDRLLLLPQGTAVGQISLSGDQVLFGGTVVGTVTLPSDSSSALTVRFNLAATSAAVQAVARSVAYSNVTLVTTLTERTISWQLVDGLGVSAIARSTKVIVSTPPKLTLPTLVQNYPSGNPGTALAPDALVEVSSSAVNGSVLTVRGTNFGPNDRLLILSQGTGVGQVSVSGDRVLFGGTAVATLTLPSNSGGSLTVRFNSAATSAAVQAVARSLAFRNTTAAPSRFARGISWQLIDGLGATSTSHNSQINVTAPVITGPKLTLPTTVRSYPSRSAGVALAPDALLEIVSTAVSGSVLTVQGTNFGPNDRVLVLSQGTGTGQVSVSGDRVLFGVTNVGTLTLITNGRGLTVRFNSAATSAAMQAVVRRVAFRNITSTPTRFARTISWQVVDNQGTSSTVRSSQVNIS